MEKPELEKLVQEAAKTDIDWGYQIRSYVLQPYQQVKHLCTNVERIDPQKGPRWRFGRVHDGVTLAARLKQAEKLA